MVQVPPVEVAKLSHSVLNMYSTAPAINSLLLAL